MSNALSVSIINYWEESDLLGMMYIFWSLHLNLYQINIFINWNFLSSWQCDVSKLSDFFFYFCFSCHLGCPIFFVLLCQAGACGNIVSCVTQLGIPCGTLIIPSPPSFWLASSTLMQFCFTLLLLYNMSFLFTMELLNFWLSNYYYWNNGAVFPVFHLPFIGTAYST